MTYFPNIQCPRCKKVSYHTDDIKYKFCGSCHEWHEFMKEDKTINVPPNAFDLVMGKKDD